YSTKCDAFWGESASWSDLRAVRGRITRVARALVPAVTIQVEAVGGFVLNESVTIRSIGIYEHPAVEHASIRLFASVVGLIEASSRNTYRLAGWARLLITQD